MRIADVIGCTTTNPRPGAITRHPRAAGRHPALLIGAEQGPCPMWRLPDLIAVMGARR